MNLKKMAVVGFIIIIGGGVAFMTIKKDTGEKNTQKLQESILISEFLMERGEYVGKGVLSEYYIYTGKEKKLWIFLSVH